MQRALHPHACEWARSGGSSQERAGAGRKAAGQVIASPPIELEHLDSSIVPHQRHLVNQQDTTQSTPLRRHIQNRWSVVNRKAL